MAATAASFARASFGRVCGGPRKVIIIKKSSVGRLHIIRAVCGIDTDMNLGSSLLAGTALLGEGSLATAGSFAAAGPFATLGWFRIIVVAVASTLF